MLEVKAFKQKLSGRFECRKGFFFLLVILPVGMNLQDMHGSLISLSVCVFVCVCVCVCAFLVYLQRLEEAKGAQSSATGHQTEGWVVEHLLVVIPAETDAHKYTHEFTNINNNRIFAAQCIEYLCIQRNAHSACITVTCDEPYSPKILDFWGWCWYFYLRG